MIPRRALLLLALASLAAGCLGSDPVEDPAHPGGGADADPLPGAPDPADPGARPHLHDYWTGRERVTLLDTDVKVDPSQAADYTFYNVLVASNPAVGGALVTLPDGATVYEGTGVLELTATWTDPTITGLALRHRSAASPEFSEKAPLASGAALAIEVSPAMTDMPHEQVSRWAFLLEPEGPGDVVEGTVHVTVDIVKMRDVTLFPAHPKLFGDAHAKTVFSGQGTVVQRNAATYYATLVTDPDALEAPALAAQALVPMETRAMTANLTITSATATAGQVSNVALRYRAADTQAFRLADPVASDPAAGTFAFAWPVEMAQTDSPYAAQSNWLFDLIVYTRDPAGATPDCSGCTDSRVDFRLDVVAYDAAPE